MADKTLQEMKQELQQAHNKALQEKVEEFTKGYSELVEKTGIHFVPLCQLTPGNAIQFVLHPTPVEDK